MHVSCRTSLDDVSVNEKWPDELPACPRPGDYIQSATKYGLFQLELEVSHITWVKGIHSRLFIDSGEWYPVIELIDKKSWNRSIIDFHKWYKAAKSGSVTR